MIKYLEPYLINFSFIVIPFFFYQMFWVGKNKTTHKYNKVVLIIVLGISIFLCLTYPMKISNGIIYDLRYIPFILSVFYGSLYVSIPLYLIMNSYRFFIGGNGFYVNLIISTLIIIFLNLIKGRFDIQSVTKKAIITTSTSVIAALIVILYAHIVSNMSLFNLRLTSLSYILSQGIAMWIINFFIQAVNENIQYQKNAIFTEKIKAISELSASISHEVRNPMTVVKGFLQMLDDPNLSQDKRNFYVKVSLTELERAEMIINDYLSMTKPQKTAIVVTNLEDDIKYVTNVIKPYSLMHNVSVSENFDNTLEVKYDKNQFRQCLLNLMKNCIESMSINGGLLQIDTFSNRDKVNIKIKDTGTGMTNEEIQRLGIPYYTTKEKGTGLGMTVVFSAIQSMDGKINIESEKGKGTIFTITLPSFMN
jgi:two-component system, sporulation sensor kinase B